MSALLTHAALGLLLGVAMRLPPKYLPVAAFLGAMPDLDHLDDFGGLPFVESRITLHNMFVLIVIPVLIFVALTWFGAKREYRQLAAASPVLLSSHVFIDLLPIDPLGGGGWAALLWPFSRTIYTVEYRHIRPMDPTTFSTFTILIVALALLSLLAVTAYRLAEDQEQKSQRKRATGVAGAYAMVWVLLLPGLFLTGFVIERPDFPNAGLAATEPAIHLPEGRLVASVVNYGGYGVGTGRIVLQLLSADQVVLELKNTNGISPGGRWNVDAAVPDARSLQEPRVRVVSADGETDYHETTVAIVRQHVDTTFETASFAVNGQDWVLVLRNGPLTVPSGAVEVRVSLGGAEVTRQTNARVLLGDGEWRLVMRPPTANLLSQATIEVRAIDDGHVYLRETRQADASGGIIPTLPPL